MSDEFQSPSDPSQDVLLTPEEQRSLQEGLAAAPTAASNANFNHRLLATLASGRDFRPWHQQILIRLRWMAIPALIGCTFGYACLRLTPVGGETPHLIETTKQVTHIGTPPALQPLPSQILPPSAENIPADLVPAGTVPGSSGSASMSGGTAVPPGADGGASFSASGEGN